MKKFQRFIAVMLLFSFALPLFAIVEDGQAMYLGGTAPGLKEETLGRLDTTQETSLAFEYSGGKLVIPYARIESFEYSETVAHHWGVVATIVVVLIKHRQRRHFFRIAYHDEKDLPQAVVFEVSKSAPQTLFAVLAARAPQGCKGYQYFSCPVRPKDQTPMSRNSQ